MARRNRVVVLLSLPIALIFYLAGWTLTCLGSKQEPIKPMIPEQKELSLIVLSQEKEIFA